MKNTVNVERKKILLIIPELMMGGAQRSLSKLSIELAVHHQVWVVVFNTIHGIAYPHGGELLSLDVNAGQGVFQKFRFFLQRIKRLRKLKRELGVDAAISFLEGADYINILSRSGEKIILSIRGSKFHDETMAGKFSWLRNRILIPRLYRKADKIVTVNSGIANELLHYGINRSAITTIGNFYDFGEITALSRQTRNENLATFYKDPVLITTGRLAPEKGLASIIRIVSKLKSKHKAIRLLIVGDGPLKNDLVALCDSVGLKVSSSPDFTTSPDVVFAGAQANVFKYLRGATIYMMNSSSEGFPNGLVEAMICHVPVISSDCPYGPREILAPALPYTTPVTSPLVSENGVLMPLIKSADDETVWVEMLDNLLGKKELLLQLADKGYNRIAQFDRETTMARWLDILK